MATPIENTIGAGGNYPTLAAWFAACPADLVAAGQIWRGLVLNQELSSASTLVTIAGKTVNAECYVELTAAAGASFLDHASKATNPLRYDATKGAGIKFTGSTGVGVLINLPYTRIRGLQFLGTSASATASSVLAVTTTAATSCDVNQCIIEGSNGGSLAPLHLENSGTVVRNTTVTQNHSAGATAHIAGLTTGAKAYNCTFVSTNLKLNAGIKGQYAAGALENCYIGNVTAPTSGSAPAVTNCATDATAAGYTTIPYSATTFESVTPGAMDLRLKTGSGLVGSGVVNATYSATDVYGTSRPQGATQDIGAYELPLAGDFVGPTMNGSITSSNITTSGFTLSCPAASDNVGVTGYEYSINGGSSYTDMGNVLTVTVTGLNAGTPYQTRMRAYDAAGNRASTPLALQVTTAASADTTAPTMSGSISAGVITASTLAFSYPAGSDNVGIAGYEISLDGTNWTANGTSLSGSFSGLTASTTYTVRARAFDAAGLRSNILTLSMTTSAAGAAGSFKTRKLSNNTVSGWPPGTALVWEWHQAGRIGTAATSVTYGSGTVDADGTLTFTGCPAGEGYGLVARRGTSLAGDNVFYQPGTVA